MPVGVGRIVPLTKPLSDDEWSRLVAELRTTFNARGKVTEQAGIREWSNGNLHASVEPAGDGYRLRLATVKGDAPALNALGFIGLAAGAATFGALAMSGGISALFVPAIFTVSGIGALAANALRLPRWAGQREAQMEAVARRLNEILDG